MPELSNMKRLWVHEILRVFADRLIDDIDLSWLTQQIRMTLREYVGIAMEDLFADLVPKERDERIRVRSY